MVLSSDTVSLFRFLISELEVEVTVASVAFIIALIRIRLIFIDNSSHLAINAT